MNETMSSKEQTEHYSAKDAAFQADGAKTQFSITAGNAAGLRVIVLGATSGIAEATCRIWAMRGASLFLVARNEDKLQGVAADLRTRGASSVDTLAADLNETALHPALLGHAVSTLGGLDVAYIAHGVLGEQADAEQDFASAADVLQTNFVSAVSLLTWLANYCEQQHSGVLAVLSSVAGDRGRKSNYVYGASKAGLSAFLEGLRNRLDRQGVTVLTIKPGPVKTAMTAGMRGSENFADPAKVAASIVKAIDARKDVVYVPFHWGPILFVIRHVPEFIFKRLNL
jgi:decaprenylphospho-beta-D-erythro-pentofuranosid-2-ulose 2-reductase